MTCGNRASMSLIVCGEGRQKRVTPRGFDRVHGRTAARPTSVERTVHVTESSRWTSLDAPALASELIDRSQLAKAQTATLAISSFPAETDRPVSRTRVPSFTVQLLLSRQF